MGVGASNVINVCLITSTPTVIPSPPDMYIYWYFTLITVWHPFWRWQSKSCALFSAFVVFFHMLFFIMVLLFWACCSAYLLSHCICASALNLYETPTVITTKAFLLCSYNSTQYTACMQACVCECLILCFVNIPYKHTHAYLCLQSTMCVCVCVCVCVCLWVSAHVWALACRCFFT